MRRQHWLMLLWAAAAAALCFFENNTGTRCVLAASLAVPAVFVLCVLYTARHLSLSAVLPEDGAAGVPFGLTLRCTGTRLRYGCMLRGTVRLLNRMTGEQHVLALSEGTVQVTPKHGGLCEASIADAFVTDWFGLVRLPLRGGASASVMVLPELFPAQFGQEDAQPSQEAGAVPAYGAGGAETIGIREYVLGDAVRMMHWKLTEKLDKPVVRETGVPADTGILLMLEMHTAPQTTADETELCARAFLSAAHALCGDGIPFRAVLAPEGLPVWFSVDTAEDEALLRGMVLTSAFDGQIESIGRLCAADCIGQQPSRIVLFSPSGETDAASLAQGRNIDLVLPETAAGAASLPEVILHTLAQDEATLIL